MIFEYKGKQYPEYIRQGNAAKHIVPFAEHFCKGDGLDIGGTREWTFPGSVIVNPIVNQHDAYNLPDNESGCDYIFSSHCLEHVPDYVKALETWLEALRPGGHLFLYLPHPEMEYWLPQNCRKHVHRFDPLEVMKLLKDLGYEDVLHSQRDLYWSFAVVGRKAYNG